MFRWRHRERNLVFKVESIVWMALGGVLAGTLLFTVSQQLYARLTALHSQSQAWVNALAVQLEPALAFDDPKAAQEILDSAATYPGLQLVVVSKASQQRVASHRADNVRVDPAQLAEGHSERTLRHIHVRSPVRSGEQELGWVAAQIDTSSLWMDLLWFVLTLTLVLGVSGSLAAMVASRGVRLALHPAVKLKRVMAQVKADQNYSLRAEVGSADEIGELTTGFNDMLERIQERDELLDDNNAKLQQLKDQAEQASKAKSDFLALMSHELRTPMSGVIGMLNLTLRQELPDKAREQITTARSNAESLLAIVNDLLDLSKIEAGKLELEHIDFSLHPLMEDALGMLQQRAREKSVDFSLDIAPQLPAHLRGDPTRLRQVLINLVGNAVKFTENGRVQVRAQAGQGAALPREGHPMTVRIEVQDTGIGMDDSTMSRLFGKFEQADSTTTRRFGGTGLGLSICKQLIDLMGGHIGVRSALGQGSTFHVEVPLEVGSKPIEQAPQHLQPHRRCLNVLVAEDAHTNQIILRSLLEEMGHRVTIAENGELALQALLAENFDLVVMDGRMPVMDGLEATRHIRAGQWGDKRLPNPLVPIIAITANAGEEDRQRMLAAGMQEFLSKPINEAALHGAIQKVIDQREIQADQALRSALADTQVPLQQRLINAFRAQTPEHLHQLEGALRRQRWPDAAIACHSIKGGLAFVAPESPAYDLAAQLERWADAGQGEAIEAQLGRFKSLLDEVTRTPPA
jgi:signal transduction histidine kinase/DNA-binding response OmpR family regulator